MYRFFLLACVSAYLVPIPARAGAISVSPNSGSAGTHFILSGGGWPKCSGTGCFGGIVVYLDGTPVYSQGTVDAFSVDLTTAVPPPPHTPPPLTPGQHTARVEGFHTCDEPTCGVSACLTTIFTVVDSSEIGDPWAHSEYWPPFTGTDLPGAFIRFFPQSAAGFSQCDSVHFIQVVRETGIYPSGRSRPLTVAEQTVHARKQIRDWADSLDVWTVSDHHIDILPGQRVPYMTIGAPYDASKPGRTGTTRDTARVSDALRRPQLAYPDSVSNIVVDLELNAFCANGAGQGQYLGRLIWQWERPKDYSVPLWGRITMFVLGLGQPTATFKNALEYWAALTGFPVPKPIVPKVGGSACP